MPFIKQERRGMIAKDQYFSIAKTPEGIQPGDRCYFYYKQMVDKWKANPRWTTAHEIYKDSLNWAYTDEDDEVAHLLAWQVFFQRWVWPYELEKMEENGDIT